MEWMDLRQLLHSLKPLQSGMGEVVPAPRPYIANPLPLSCDNPV